MSLSSPPFVSFPRRVWKELFSLLWLLKINERDRDTQGERLRERDRQGYKERQKRELGRRRQRRQIWKHEGTGGPWDRAEALKLALKAIPGKEYGLPWASHIISVSTSYLLNRIASFSHSTTMKHSS